MKKPLVIIIRYAILSIVFKKRRCRSGDDCEEVTPVPIPNTEVKLFSADGSWGFPPARVGRRRSHIFTFDINVMKLLEKSKIIT